jgi:hypothetical protein
MTIIPNFNTEYVGFYNRTAYPVLPVIGWQISDDGSVAAITPAGIAIAVQWRCAWVVDKGHIYDKRAYLSVMQPPVEVAR